MNEQIDMKTRQSAKSRGKTVIKSYDYLLWASGHVISHTANMRASMPAKKAKVIRKNYQVDLLGKTIKLAGCNIEFKVKCHFKEGQKSIYARHRHSCFEDRTVGPICMYCRADMRISKRYRGILYWGVQAKKHLSLQCGSRRPERSKETIEDFQRSLYLISNRPT